MCMFAQIALPHETVLTKRHIQCVEAVESTNLVVARRSRDLEEILAHQTTHMLVTMRPQCASDNATATQFSV